MNEPASTASTLSDDDATSAPPPSFEMFFEDEAGRLMRAIYVLTGNAQESEEIMQDAFISVWEQWPRVSEMDNPTGYLYRTAMNRYRSRLRRAARATKIGLNLVEGGDEFAAAEERDALARALARLPTRQRIAIVLTELLGYGSKEAARVMGVRDVTVRSLASRGRAALRQEMESENE
jgi:RNA polymerase sigma factor (sigma-70 family)